jgi:signal transduction histidine kinase
MLGGIALNAGLLAQHAEADGERGLETLRHAERIQRFTARMNRLVGDLLDVVSLEAGQLALSRETHDAQQLVHEVVDSFQPSFAARKLLLTVDSLPSPALAEFDYERVAQVLANLLGNALKFAPAGGGVVVRVETSATELRCSVVDSGPGVPVERREAIFERFQQGSRKDRRGLGLGLYIAKCIVDAHGGRIWVEPAEPQGSVFHFTLPRA